MKCTAFLIVASLAVASAQSYGVSATNGYAFGSNTNGLYSTGNYAPSTAYSYANTNGLQLSTAYNQAQNNGYGLVQPSIVAQDNGSWLTGNYYGSNPNYYGSNPNYYGSNLNNGYLYGSGVSNYNYGSGVYAGSPYGNYANTYGSNPTYYGSNPNYYGSNPNYYGSNPNYYGSNLNNGYPYGSGVSNYNYGSGVYAGSPYGNYANTYGLPSVQPSTYGNLYYGSNNLNNGYPYGSGVSNYNYGSGVYAGSPYPVSRASPSPVTVSTFFGEIGSLDGSGLILNDNGKQLFENSNSVNFDGNFDALPAFLQSQGFTPFLGR